MDIMGLTIPEALLVVGLILAAALYANHVLTSPIKPPSGDHWVRPKVLPPDEPGPNDR